MNTLSFWKNELMADGWLSGGSGVYRFAQARVKTTTEEGDNFLFLTLAN